jgi:hypothetical protein
MRTILFIFYLSILIVISACATPQYYSFRNNIEKVPCFGKDNKALPEYYYELEPSKEVEYTLSRVNGIFVGGMYPFVFKDVFDVKNPLKCSELDKRENIRAYVSLFSQPLIKEKPVKKDAQKVGNINAQIRSDEDHYG